MIFALVSLAAVAWLFVIVCAVAWLLSKLLPALYVKNLDADGNRDFICEAGMTHEQIITAFVIVFAVSWVAAFIGILVLAVNGEKHASDQAETDAIARHIALAQKTEGAVLCLRRDGRIP